MIQARFTRQQKFNSSDEFASLPIGPSYSRKHSTQSNMQNTVRKCFNLDKTGCLLIICKEPIHVIKKARVVEEFEKSKLKNGNRSESIYHTSKSYHQMKTIKLRYVYHRNSSITHHITLWKIPIQRRHFEMKWTHHPHQRSSILYLRQRSHRT